MSYLQYRNIRQFNMVIDPGLLYCIRVGDIFSKYYRGEKRDHRKSHYVKRFYLPLFVLIGRSIKSERSIFSWRSDGSGFDRILVDNSCSVQAYGKEAGRFRNGFFVYDPLYDHHQYSAIKNDRGACS